VTASASAASRIARQTGLAVREARLAGSQHGYQHLMVTLAGGRRAFVKTIADTAPAAADSDEVAAAERATGYVAGGILVLVIIVVAAVLLVDRRRKLSEGAADTPSTQSQSLP